MAAAGPPTIKVEPADNVGVAPHIKAEDGLSPGTIKAEPSDFEDDDGLYEDAGDLDMTHADEAVWLVKLPSFVAERWNEIDDEEEITLGYIKVRTNDQSHLKLSLERNKINGMQIPTEYNLDITNMKVNNTFVFTEKDMPGYENRAEANVKDGQPAIPTKFLSQYQDRPRKGDTDGAGKKDWKNNRYQPYMRKAIPKRTALVGNVKHECALLPVDNPEYAKFQRARVMRENAPKYQTKWLDTSATRGNLLVPGTTDAASKSFSNFVRPTVVARKPTDAKAARMAKSDLISALFQCFSEHEYWSMRGFRERLVQPETYLKQTLDEIAVLHKSGPYNGRWGLKDEWKNIDPRAAAAQASTAGGAGDTGVIEIDDDDDDDDLVEMEDIPLKREGA